MRESVVVIGAGQAGLAMSRHLTAGGLDHVVLEQGEVANSWRTERWDSLRLLTPNWMTRMPGHGYQGDDPDGFATASEVVSFLDAYRQSLAGPVLTGVTVTGVTATDTGFDVVTDHGRWECDAVVAATGGSSVPRIPSVAADVPHRIDQLTALRLSTPRAARRRRRSPGGRGVGLRRPNRRRAAAKRPAGDDRGGRARAASSHVPRPRHLLVDGRDRPARRAVRRGGRHRTSASTRLRAARRHRRPRDARSEHAERARRAAGRQAHADRRWRRAVLGRRWPTSSPTPI